MTTTRALRLLVLLIPACAGPERAAPQAARQSETAIDEPRVPPAPSVPVVTTKPANSRPAKAASKTAKPPVEPVQKTTIVAQESAKPQSTPSPSLDLKGLESRLKETKAIGFFTKVGIKNQVDDLLDQFRVFYAGRGQSTLPELRQAYDRLILKVLALLQDTDPPLAHEIVASREKIWGVLADPSTFATI